MKKKMVVALLFVGGIIAGCSEKKPAYTIDGKSVSEEQYEMYADSIAKAMVAQLQLEYKQEQIRKGIYEATDTIYFGDMRILIDKVEEKENTDAEMKKRYASMIPGGVDRKIFLIYGEFLNTSTVDTLVFPYVFYQAPRKAKNGPGFRSVSEQEKLMELMGSRMLGESETEELCRSYKIAPGEKKNLFYISFNSVKDSEEIRLSYGGKVDNGMFTFHSEAGDNPFLQKIFARVQLNKEEITLPKGYLEKEITIDLSAKLISPKEE